MFPNSEVTFQVHFLNFTLKLFKLCLEGFIFDNLFLELGFVLDEVGAHQEFAIAKNTYFSAHDFTINAKGRFREVAFLLAASLAVAVSAKSTVHSFLFIDFGHLTGVAVI